MGLCICDKGSSKLCWRGLTCWQGVNEVLLVRVDVLTRGRRSDEKRMEDELERVGMVEDVGL